MPSGKNHDRITLLSLPWVVGITALVTRKSQLTFLVSCCFLFSGLMFGPDLDIYSVQYQRWGILRWFWLPYQKMLKHRSFFSHGFLIGTVLRLCYLFSGLFLVSLVIIPVCQLFLQFSFNWQVFFLSFYSSIVTVYPQEIISLFVGLELGAMSHTLADSIDSRWKLARKDAKTKRRKKRF
jgi:uncharacterized metal-binding protein